MAAQGTTGKADRSPLRGAFSSEAGGDAGAPSVRPRAYRETGGDADAPSVRPRAYREAGGTPAHPVCAAPPSPTDC